VAVRQRPAEQEDNHQEISLCSVILSEIVVGERHQPFSMGGEKMAVDSF
jgi:hypothetical protein